MAVFLEVARRNRDVLRPAGGAAGRREHGRPLGGQQVGLASQHPLDVRAQCVVTGRWYASLEIAHRTDAGEAVLAPVLRVAVAAHDVEQFALLAEHRLASGRLEPVGVAEPQQQAEHVLRGWTTSHATTLAASSVRRRRP